MEQAGRPAKSGRGQAAHRQPEKYATQHRRARGVHRTEPDAGTRLTASNTTTYVRIDCRVSASLATAGSIGTPTSRYWRQSKRASDQKCGGVQKKMTANSATAGRLRDPVTTAQPTSGGKAPAAPPTTMFWLVDRFSHTVYTNT